MFGLFDAERIGFFGFILMRVSAFILFNPILGRRNIPGLAKGAMIMGLSLLICFYIPYTPVEIRNISEYLVMLFKESLAGFTVGFVVTLFVDIVISGCEIIDMQMGLGMSKMYDPTSNIQMGITSSTFNALFILIFLAMGCHLQLINIFMNSYKIIPYGDVVFFTEDLSKSILMICIDTIEMSVRFAMPLMAIELFVEMGVGLLMKAVPQINVFVINIQLKLVIGLLALLAMLPIMSDFMTRVIDLMKDAVLSILRLLV